MVQLNPVPVFGAQKNTSTEIFAQIVNAPFQMWKDHHCYGYIINRAFRSQKIYILKSKMVWYFIGVYIMFKVEHHMAAWRNEISVLVLKTISLVRCAHSWNIFHVSVRPCNIPYLLHGNFSFTGCKESGVREPGASGFYYRASEFCS